MSDMNFYGGSPVEAEDLDYGARGDDFESPSLEDQVLARQEQQVPEPAPESAAEVPQEPEPAAEGAEESGGEPGAEPEPEPAREQRIPKSRFDDVNERRKAAERRAAELEAQLKQQAPRSDYDFDAAEDAYADALLEGDKEKARSIRREIRAQEMAQAQALAQAEANQARELTHTELDFRQTCQALEAEFPVFRDGSEEYDQELVDEVVDMQAGFVSRGYSPAAAMRKAVNYVARANGIVPVSERQAPTPQPTALATPRSTVKSKLDAATKQPPMQGGTSGGEVAPDYKNLSDSEWDALPAATKARLRGDLL